MSQHRAQGTSSAVTAAEINARAATETATAAKEQPQLVTHWVVAALRDAELEVDRVLLRLSLSLLLPSSLSSLLDSLAEHGCPQADVPRPPNCPAGLWTSAIPTAAGTTTGLLLTQRALARLPLLRIGQGGERGRQIPLSGRLSLLQPV